MSFSESDIINDSDRSSSDSEENFSAVEFEEESGTLDACGVAGMAMAADWKCKTVLFDHFDNILPFIPQNNW